MTVVSCSLDNKLLMAAGLLALGEWIMTDPTAVPNRAHLFKAAPTVAAIVGLFAASAAMPQEPLPLPDPAVSQLEATAPKSETMTIRLGVDEKTEVMAVLQKAKVIVYDWKVEGGKVHVDFHGHDPSQGKHYWVRYEEAGQQDGVTARHGSLVAPFAGEHGWYWKNISPKPVTIHLTVTGYFDRMVDHSRPK